MSIASRIESMYDHVGDVYDTITNVYVNTGKNLFDKNNANILNNIYIVSDNLETTTGAKTLYIGCEPNTTYTISRVAGQRFVVGDTIATPANGVSVSNITFNDTGTSITTTTSANAQYIVVGYYVSSVDTKTEQEILNSIMINKGSTALPYEPYIDNPIYKNIENIPKVINKSYLNIMNNGYQDIWDSWDKRTSSGAEMSIDGTEEAPMSLTYKGNTYQYSSNVAGKNLFNYNSTHYVNDCVLTINDGELKLNGLSADYNGQAWWGINVSNYTGNITISYGELNGFPLTANDRYLAYCFMDSIPTTWSNMGALTVVDKTNKYATTSLGSGDYLILVLQAQHGNAHVDGWASINEVQVELGSSPTSYEPFAGATPAPENPSPVQAVSGDNSIEVCGKNIAPTDWASKFVSAINNNNVARLETKDNRNCLYYGASAGYGDYPNKNLTLGMTFKENTQYTISFDLLKVTAKSKTIAIYYTDNTYQSINDVAELDTWYHITLTSTANKTIKYIQPYYTSGNTYIDLNTWQIEEGTTATTYQPYTSASYPISLGYSNLFNINGNVNTRYNGTTPSSIQNIVVGENLTSLTDTSVHPYGQKIYVGTGTTVSLSVKAESITYTTEPTSSQSIGGVYIYNDNTTSDRLNTGFLYSDLGTIKTNTFTSTTDYIFLCFYRTTNTTSTTFTNIMLETGNTSHSYIPYGEAIELCKIGTYQDKIDKSSGKNLFDDEFEVGTFNSNGINASDITRIRTKNYTSVKPNTQYTLGYINHTGRTSQISISYYSTNDFTTSRLSYLSWGTSNPVTFTTPANCNYIRFLFSTTDAGTMSVSNVSNIMLNEGSTALPYEPYGTGWYLKKEIGKVILNENNNWTLWDTGGRKIFHTPIIDGIGTDCFCNYLSKSASVGYPDYNCYIYNGNLNKNFVLRLSDDTTITTVDGFKAWVSTHNLIVYYQLETPTYEYITDTTLIGQLEALKKSYEGQTNISQVNNDLPFELDVVALSDGTVSTLSLGSPLLGSSSQPEETQEEVLEEPTEEEENDLSGV